MGKNMHTIWFTGLSRSGMSTLGESLANALRSRGHHVEVLDGKIVREELGDYFGYSREERIRVSRVLSMMAKMLSRHGIIPIVTSITPYQESRDFNRSELSRYLEIFLDCPVDVCLQRDHTGQYRRAMQGDITHFVGVDDPYEIPRNPDLRVCTAVEAVEESAARVREFVFRAICEHPHE